MPIQAIAVESVISSVQKETKVWTVLVFIFLIDYWINVQIRQVLILLVQELKELRLVSNQVEDPSYFKFQASSDQY